MMLNARVVLRFVGFSLDLDLTAAAGENVAIVGPNGAGKTTFLHALAGLQRIDEGRIVLDGQVLDAGPNGAFVSPDERRVGMLFQDHLLFPHLDVLENVAFGPRSRGMRRRPARTLARSWLERLNLHDLASRKPHSLSGGQSQRVALARALATAPRMLLLDEPLAAVDASAKRDLRHELRSHLREFAGVRLMVVHDIADALALADRVVVLEAGRIVQRGPLSEIVTRPRSRYVADLVGVNCFHGTCHGGVITLPSGSSLIAATPLEGPVTAIVHPRAIALYRQRPSGSPRNVWEAPVVALEPSLDRVRVQLGGAIPIVAEVTPSAVRDLGLQDLPTLWLAIKATEIEVVT